MKTSLKAVFGLAMSLALGAGGAWAQGDTTVAEAIKKGAALPEVAAKVAEPQPAAMPESMAAAAAMPDVPDAASNYAFATGTDASLTNMSTGTTQLLGPNVDDTASAVTNIGFSFIFQGTAFTQFSVNDNGAFRFGPTALAGGSPYQPLAVAGQSKLTAFGADQSTSGTGKVHYRVDGAAPSRVLIVEWLNSYSHWQAPRTADLTYQVRLYEGTGVIEYVYGAMTMGTAGAAAVDSQDPQFGFSSSNTAGTVGSVTAAQSGSPAPTFNGASATAVNNLYVAGAITVLDSAADGARRYFRFTPPAATAPTALTFSAITPTGMTLNWVDSPNEIAYEIFRSTDGTNFTSAGTAAQDATSFVASGLAPSTTYFWRVVAYSEGSASTPLAGSQASGAPGNVVSTAAGGNWSDPATWVGGSVPTAGDNATISNGATVTIDTAAVALSVSVGTGGSPNALLQWDSAMARTLTVGTNVTVAANGRFATPNTNTVTTHVLSLGGNLVNNGELDFSTNADTAGAGISFTGTAAATFGGTGATTDVRAVTVIKGAIANTLELNPSNFTVRGVTTNVAGFLTLTSGTFKVSGTFALENRFFTTAIYTIPATGGFWLNNPNVTVSGQASGTTTVNNGLFRISSGIYNIGVTGADGMGGGTGAVFTIEGGTINATRIDPQNAVTWTQSGGTVNVGVVANTRTGGYGTFELYNNTASTFTMSGGTINLVQAAVNTTPIDLQIRSNVVNVTGGVVNVGTAATATNFNFRLRGNVPNVVIDNTTNAKTATATAQVNFRGTTLINTGTTLVINGQVCLVLGPTFTNNGTLTGTATSTRFYFLGGQGATTYTGSGAVTAPLTAWEVDNVAGVTIDPSVNPITTLRVNMFSGGITGAGKLTIGNGGATASVVQFGVATPTGAVTGFDAAPTFNPGSAGAINIYAQELSARTTGVEVLPSRTLSTLSVSNTNGVTIAGGDITVNGTAATALSLTDAPVITGANTLYFDTATGGVTRTLAGRVIGNFRKSYATAGSKTFEVGTANGYSPVVVNATAGTFPADVTVSAVQAVAPTLFPAADGITRHWNVTAPNVSSADLTFTYLDPADLGTVVEADLDVFRRDGAAFTDLNGTIDTTANTGAVTGVTSFGVFTLAEPGVTSVDQADLQITKTDGVTTVTAGGSTTYTIVASNPNGPQAMSGATVADTFPSALACAWTCAGSGGGTCSASGSGNINDTVNLPVGGAVTYSATCAIDLLASGTLVNTATVTLPGGTFDPDTNNNSATDTDTIVAPQADVSITKTDGVAVIAPGQPTTYTIVASNAGPAGVTGATVADTFTAALTGCAWTCTGSGGGSCGASGSGNINELVNLPSGGSATFLATCTVSPSASGSLANTATISMPGAYVDPNPANNSATDTNTVQQTANVELLILNDFTKVQVGDNVTLTVVVQNAGPSAAPSVAIAGTVPPELGFFSWTCVGLSGGTCGAPSGSGSFATTASLPSGGAALYTVQAQVLSEDANGNVSFSATATVGGSVADPNTANNTDTWEASVVLFANGFDCTVGRDCGPPASPPDYLTGFEAPDYTVGDVNSQQSWFAQFANWLVSTANPPAGAQAVRGLSDGLGSSFALSPTLPAGTEAYSYASAKITINNATTGATWRFAPQDTGAALVITRLHFVPAGNAILALQGNPATYVTIPSATWPSGTPFTIKVITRRADGQMEVCLNGASIFMGQAISTTANARDTRNVALGSLMESGSTGSTMDFDDVTIDNTETGGCGGTRSAEPNTLIGTIPGSVVADSPASPTVRQ
ncbi:MAG: DUF11 domain-containing protein [Xanthomonadales bacterium]|nr:DUF11 domain-containing protein [Xanthomonadales bacterium]